MKYIFSTGSLYNYSIERCFQFAREADFDGIEVMVDQRWDTRQPDYLNMLVDRYQLPILAVHSPFSPRLDGWPGDDVGRVKHSVSLAEAVGAPVVVHHLPIRIGYLIVIVPRVRQGFVPAPGWDMDAGYRQWLESDYERYQDGTAVTLCIENMPARQVFKRRRNIHSWNDMQAIKRFPNLTLDTTHLGTWGVEPYQILPELDGRVRHVHLSNYDGREHRLPESGDLNLQRFVGMLAERNYSGSISFELHPDALDAGEDDGRLIALLSGSLERCRAWETGVGD